ncbi:MAG: threonyl-tRNA synthetase editing domain-containing protein [Candidatus Marinimicrobia bacterium]|nr:threonyl-tRNA synthetase editing domain-containing protein [Candidatus Neomarinimicrobiota bacterium]
MKLLMIYSDKFGYRTNIKNLEAVEKYNEEKQIENALIGFIQVEEKDEENIAKTETKMIKNLKWAAKKNETTNIVLHSFAHLSMSKADEKITKNLFDRAETRLKNSDYNVSQTPFGYFLDLDIQAPGESLARVFKEF